MKFVTVIMSALSAPLAGGSVRALVRLLLVLLFAVVAFSAGFQVIMTLEGREYTWVSSAYWTVVTMTTLGFGDIVFVSDLGRLYSVVVLLTGAILILVLLPFTFIQLAYLPLREAAQHAKTPRELPEDLHGHVLLTGREPLEELLMHRAEVAGIPYALIVEDVQQAVMLSDQGYRVLVGDLDDPATYRAARAEQAALLVTARSDQMNTNIAFTVREVSDRTTVVATADSNDSVDVLELAGCDRVIQLGQLLGQALARRVLAPTARCTTISSFGDLVIAEASAAGTQLVDQTLEDLDLTARFGVSVVGLWDRGQFQLAHPHTRIEASSILLLTGQPEQLDAYDQAMTDPADAGQQATSREPELVVILGGGRVGRSLAADLTDANVDYRIVDRLPERIEHLPHHIVGDAADREILRDAGLDHASAIAITTHDDDTNVYLTLYCRKLRPEIEILTRVNNDKNLSTLHRAGADVVLSYASTGAMEAWNALREHSTLLLAEGLIVFKTPVPHELAHRTLREADLPGTTGCTVIAITTNGDSRTDTGPTTPLPPGAELILIGDPAAEERYLTRYIAERPPSWTQRIRRRLNTLRPST